MVDKSDFTSGSTIFTQFPSKVFVCESMFDEGKRLILPLVGGTMKKYRLGPAALVDEVLVSQHLLLENDSCCHWLVVGVPIPANDHTGKGEYSANEKHLQSSS